MSFFCGLWLSIVAYWIVVYWFNGSLKAPVRPLSSCGASCFPVPKPIGRLGNSWHKVRQSRVNANERPAVGLDFFGAAFHILPQNGYSPKNPVQFLG